MGHSHSYNSADRLFLVIGGDDDGCFFHADMKTDTGGLSVGEIPYLKPIFFP
jgi:hypothetical protein